MSSNQVIVIGGGLAGLSAAHTVIEHGGSVVVLDKSAFLGGNSTKATSGINGSYTQAQCDHKSPDSVRLFEQDTNLSFHGGKPGGALSPLVKTLTHESGDAVNWLSNKFSIDLSILGHMGGHSAPRTHRGKERFPGMTITYGLTEALENIEKAGGPGKIITKARATRLLKDANGAVTGVAYEKGGKEYTLEGPVIICTGGFAADFSKDSLLAKNRPDLLHLSTTNGEHCTGDGLKMAESVGAGLVDMQRVQVHPSGLVAPNDPTAKVKFLAAEALRGTGALVLNKDGKRFMNELGRRDYCSGEMFKNKGPFRLILNSKCAKEIEWHCKHYQSRGLMKFFKSGADLAKEMGVPVSTLDKTFTEYNNFAQKKSDPFGKRFYKNTPWAVNDTFYVAQITPVLHYTMGGVYVNANGEALAPDGKVVPGLYAAGEAAGGVHGINRLGGNSLLDCVVYGRVTGRKVTAYMLKTYFGKGTAGKRLGVIASHLQPASGNVRITIDIGGGGNAVAVNGAGAAPAGAVPAIEAPEAPAAAAPAAAPAAAAPAAPAKRELKKYTMADVAKHTKENDCWVVVGKQVLDVTKFMPDHPGGVKAIMLYAGKDATEEFDMLHKREVIDKYAPDAVIGTLA